MVEKAGLPLAEAVRMVTENTAKLYHIFDRAGSIEQGKQADLVVLDRTLSVLQVYVSGTRVR